MDKGNKKDQHINSEGDVQAMQKVAMKEESEQQEQQKEQQKEQNDAVEQPKSYSHSNILQRNQTFRIKSFKSERKVYQFKLNRHFPAYSERKSSEQELSNISQMFAHASQQLIYERMNFKFIQERLNKLIEDYCGLIKTPGNRQDINFVKEMIKQTVRQKNMMEQTLDKAQEKFSKLEEVYQKQNKFNPKFLMQKHMI